MNVADILEGGGGFQILQTTVRAQTATMRLRTGEASAETPEAHCESDQVVLVLEGELHAEVDVEECSLPSGTCLLIPAGTRHRLINRGRGDVLLFTTYSPPAYPATGEE